jgi:hypothetical protein
VKEVTVTPTSPIKGKAVPEAKTSLTLLDVRGAFVSAQVPFFASPPKT